MNRDCKSYQSSLIDIFYNEGNMSSEIQNHMEDCHDCKCFWQELHGVKAEMDKGIIEPSIEYAMISQAFENAEAFQGKKRNFIDLALFIILSGFLLGLVAFLAVKGHLVEIMYFQMAAYLIIPLSLPVIIKIRSAKEGYNGQN